MRKDTSIYIRNNVSTPTEVKTDCFPFLNGIKKINFCINKNPIISIINRIKKLSNRETINKKTINPNNSSNLNKLENTKHIKIFTNEITNKKILQIDENNKLLIDNINNDSLILDKKNCIGSGTYGVAYRVGNFAIKIPKNKYHLETYFACLGRSRRILNQINNDNDYSRVITSKNGIQVLISKFIDGQSVTGKEAYQFVKSRGRILHDYQVDGNVKKDKQGKLYLIDADFASLPIEARRNSLGSEQLYNEFPEYTRHYLKLKKI
ncbi:MULTISPECIES: hypothetical protein [unclassified Providencia]|nr:MULTISPECIES: hypothetical protein [Providencia]PYZ52374.1 hypothetical protein DNK63_20650 [Providencia rettgeri]WOB95257.1 hypothetical protein P3L54_00105 [Providencia sp. PROV099]